MGWGRRAGPTPVMSCPVSAARSHPRIWGRGGGGLGPGGAPGSGPMGCSGVGGAASPTAGTKMGTGGQWGVVAGSGGQPPAHLQVVRGHEVQAGAGGDDVQTLKGGWCEGGGHGKGKVGGTRGLTSGLECSVGVLGDPGGLPHGLGGSVGVLGDSGGLPHDSGGGTSPTRSSTALRSSRAGGLQPRMLSQMPTMCWHCG